MPLEQIHGASYLDGDSILHRCDARVKILLLVFFLLTITLLPIGAWVVYLLMAGLLLIAFLLSDLPSAILLKRSLWLELPIILVLLPQIFIRNGEMLDWHLLWNWQVSISLTGLERILSLIFRSWLSIQFVVVITSVTRFEDLLLAMRACGLPRLLASIFSLMWRYLFILVAEVQRMLQARSARSTAVLEDSAHSGGSLFWRARVTGGMAGTLLLRSIERSERVYQAMQSRGFDGEIKKMETSPLNIAQWGTIFFFAMASLLLIFLARGLYL